MPIRPLVHRLAPPLIAVGAVAAIALNIAATRGEGDPPATLANAVPANAVDRPAIPAPPAVKPARIAPAPISKPSADPFVVRRVLDVPSPFQHGDWVWNEKGAPATGPVVVTVDLAAQTLSAFRDGYEIGAAVILYGADNFPTPLGVYPISEKDADHVSNLYAAPMPYMLRLTNDGVSIHGSKVEWGAATHGCIGVPIGFAKKLFAATQIGTRVIVTRGKRLHMGDAIEKPDERRPTA
ncbi:L,D-transpeptidase family protein [Sphingomonas sp. EC-HK361]|uniref:L,D-transpeptidase family protein n=1 Tax=Sphingomonas sp. EC-HK361 TaxID=2038397 RepID=UPI00125EA4F2|nr:L,D-transpeptidase family protein [Sphingomonas sp. EC-HK361]